jgi:hypothetical protein
MVKFFEDVESSPRLISVDQILTSDLVSTSAKSDVNNAAESMRQHGKNFAFPTVCMTEDEDKYDLITGLPILEAAKLAGLSRVWVFLLAVKRPEASELVDHLLLQGELNQVAFKLSNIEVFIRFLDQAKESDLIRISGIKEKTAERIISKRPFNSLDDLKKLGNKQPWRWLKSYSKVV